MNLRPGVDIGIEKQIAYLLSWSLRSEPGYTASSSAKGASVASMRAPRTRIPFSVSSTLWSETSPAACSASATERSTCGLMSVCVSDRSLSRMNFWNSTMLRAPSSFPERAHTSARAAKQAKV